MSATPMDILAEAMTDLKTQPEDIGVKVIEVTDTWPDALIEGETIPAQRVILIREGHPDIHIAQTNPSNDDLSGKFYVQGDGYRLIKDYHGALSMLKDWVQK